MAKGDICILENCNNITTSSHRICSTHRTRKRVYGSYEKPSLKEKLYPCGIVKICRHHGNLRKEDIVAIKRKTYSTSWCRLCRNTKQRNYCKKNPEYMRNQNLYTRFKIRRHEYDNLVSEQGNKCAICNRPETYINKKLDAPNPLSIDHCHVTGKIRELLCQKCNTILGMANDSDEILQEAIKYLRRHKAAR